MVGKEGAFGGGGVGDTNRLVVFITLADFDVWWGGGREKNEGGGVGGGRIYARHSTRDSRLEAVIHSCRSQAQTSGSAG